MTVGTWVDPDFETQKGDSTAYVTNIDNAFAVAKRFAIAFAAHESSPPDMKVQLDAGYLPAEGVLPTEVAAQETAVLVAPGANPRNDVVYIDKDTGVVGVAQGTEAASPTDPDIPDNKVAIARVRLLTSTTEITNTDLDDLRGIEALGGVAGSEVAKLAEANIFTKRQTQAPIVSIASAATLALNDSTNAWSVTGSATITKVTGVPAGTEVEMIAAGNWSISADGDNIIMAPASSYTVGIGQVLRFRAHAEDKLTFMGGHILVASSATIEAGVNNSLAVTAGRMHRHPGVAKAWVAFDQSGTLTVGDSYNVTSVTDDAVGRGTVNFTTAFSSADYVPAGFGGPDNAGTNHICVVARSIADANQTASACPFTTWASFNGIHADFDNVGIAFFGDQ